MKAAALEFVRVSGGYRRVPVFEALSFTVASGEMCGVIGPNGSGKTTLLRAATGLLDRLEGEVRLFGEAVRTLPAPRRAQLVGVVPQELSTPMAYTVEELVAMGRTHALQGWGALSAEDRRIVEQAMVYTDVVDMRDRPFPELSGGEKQRAVIAMVVAQQPRLILLDEATSHLDINHALETMQLVERLNREQGVTVVMVSHDLNMAAEFCGRLLLLDRGRLVADGTPASVLTEDALRRVYRCDVRVQPNPLRGSVTVIPAPRLTAGGSGRGVRVHVVAGGGCGEEVLRRLVLCEYSVTCGVLNEGDSDAGTAAALGVAAALEKPFSPVGPEAMAVAEQFVDAADVVVVCGVPFGPGNAVNLQLAARAMDAGKPVMLMAGVGGRDYTPDRRAAAAGAALVRRGAREWSALADLFAALRNREASDITISETLS